MGYFRNLFIMLIMMMGVNSQAVSISSLKACVVYMVTLTGADWTYYHLMGDIRYSDDPLADYEFLPIVIKGSTGTDSEASECSIFNKVCAIKLPHSYDTTPCLSSDPTSEAHSNSCVEQYSFHPYLEVLSNNGAFGFQKCPVQQALIVVNTKECNVSIETGYPSFQFYDGQKFYLRCPGINYEIPDLTYAKRLRKYLTLTSICQS